MVSRRLACFLTALALTVGLGRGLALAQGTPPGMYGAGGAAAPMAQPMVLTDAKVTGFFDAMDAFKALGKKGAAEVPADPSRPEAFTKSLQMSAETQAILDKNGFADMAEFQRVGYNAAMAYGVIEQGGKEAVRKKMEAAKAQQAQAMEKLKQHVSPEQLKMMTAQMEAAMATGGGMQNVPDENVTLMEKYRDRMAKMRSK